LLLLLRVGRGEVQRLDCHLPLQLWIARQVNDALRASTQLANQLETSNLLAHRLLSLAK